MIIFLIAILRDLRNFEIISISLLKSSFNSSKRKTNGYTIQVRANIVIPAIKFKEAKYTIELIRRNIINQKIAAVAECPLKGRTFIAKNITKIREEILRFKKILK
ncbi:MAG: hypothetical protein ACFE8C_12970 [Promethearchaeota archaeon]